MEYNFWQDFFDTYQSLSNTLKILWIITPALFILALVAVVLYYKYMIAKIKNPTDELKSMNKNSNSARDESQ